MTRGTFFLIKEDLTVLESTEFNGDMYPEGYGDIAFTMLKDVINEKSFIEMVTKFNEENHNYDDEKLIHQMDCMFDKDYYIDFNVDYFGRFFSDWLFMKNLSKKDITFTDRENVKSYIKIGETIRLNFGRLCEYSRKLCEETKE
jgi:hypothetical protein